MLQSFHYSFERNDDAGSIKLKQIFIQILPDYVYRARHSILIGRGWIEVICGSMFSGKTEELIRRLRRAQIANLRVGIFKPQSDDRYHRENIVSHDENSIPSIPVSHAKAILEQVSTVDVVGIDEAQFFDEDLPRSL